MAAFTAAFANRRGVRAGMSASHALTPAMGSRSVDSLRAEDVCAETIDRMAVGDRAERPQRADSAPAVALDVD